MGQELVTQTRAVGSSLDQPGHVRNRQLTLVRAVDDAEDGLQRGERVVRHLRLRIGDEPKQRGLARIREAGERRIDDELQAKLEIDLVTREARFGKTRRLTTGSVEAGLAPAALTPARNDDPAARSRQVGERTARGVQHLGAEWNPEVGALAVRTVLLASTPPTTTAGLHMPHAPER